jgi:hypothetical protein
VIAFGIDEHGKALGIGEELQNGARAVVVVAEDDHLFAKGATEGSAVGATEAAHVNRGGEPGRPAAHDDAVPNFHALLYAIYGRDLRVSGRP